MKKNNVYKKINGKELPLEEAIESKKPILTNRSESFTDFLIPKIRVKLCLGYLYGRNNLKTENPIPMMISGDETLFQSAAIPGFKGGSHSFIKIKIFKVVRGTPHARIDQSTYSLGKNETTPTTVDAL